MQTKPAGPDVVDGYDVSHWNGHVNHQAYFDQGKRFCFIKACENGRVDECFEQNWMETKKAGLLRGAYAFFHPSRDPLGQANQLLNLTGPLQVGDLPHVIDWETTDGVPSDKDKKAAYLFLGQLHKITGRMPIIYGSPYFLSALQLDDFFAGFPLWVAHYEVPAPLVPSPWPNWTFWQTSESGGMDFNLYNGTLQSLKNLAGLT